MIIICLSIHIIYPLISRISLTHFHPLSPLISLPPSVTFLIMLISYRILHIWTKFLSAAGAADLWSDHVTTYTRASAKSVQSVKLCKLSYQSFSVQLIPLWLYSFSEAAQIPDKKFFWRLSTTAISRLTFHHLQVIVHLECMQYTGADLCFCRWVSVIF